MKYSGAFLIVVTSCLLVWFGFYKIDHPKTYTVCGTVVKKFDSYETYDHKGRVISNPEFYMDFHNTTEEKYERLTVEANTYYRYNEGNNICFIRENRDGWDFLIVICSIIGGIILFCFGIAFAVNIAVNND